MPVPSIMAVWQGTQPGSFGGFDIWKRQVTLFLRARAVEQDMPPTSYYRLFRVITKGVSIQSGQPLLNTTAHPDCYPMDLPMIQRQTDGEGLD